MANWKIAEPINEDEKIKFPDINPVILQLLRNRGLTDAEEIDKFLRPQYDDLHSPFLFRDMKKLVARVRQARDNQETVCVYGDYDSDGVCSSVLLFEALRAVGLAKVEVYIPHREKEGYGLNKAAIDYLAGLGVKLLMTVDCGSTNVEEVDYARQKGLDVIIIDHHELPAKPPAGVVAFINPHLAGETYPFADLAAVGVTFKAAQALWQEFNLPSGQDKWFLDLAAIATITDMMPLVGENRVLVKFGLKVLNKTRRPGLQFLVKAMRGSLGKLDVYDVGFKIGPRLNAAGRIDHANTAYELLETSDAEAASKLARELNAANAERQAAMERAVKQALLQVEAQLPHNKVLLAVGDDWPVGVVGLVSGKITERFNRPSLVVTRTAKGLVGSGRSIAGFDITAALAEIAPDYLERFGGHAGACGLTLKPVDILEDFIKAINIIADKKLSEDDLIKALKIDAVLTLDQVNWDLVSALENMAPFGMANPRPRFASNQVKISDIKTMGSDGQHLRLMLWQNNTTREAVSFGSGAEWGSQLQFGDMIDAAYEIDINEWNGERRLQLKVADIKKASNNAAGF